MAMRVLGIDCGSVKTGYGVIDSDGRRHSIVTAGTIETTTSFPMSARLVQIAVGIREVIALHQPMEAGVEDVFHSVNAKSAIKLSQVRGAVLLVLAEAGLECGEYSPLSVKQSVVGHGRAEKEQVQFMVRSLLGAETPTHLPDACDALAVAICHATRAVRAA